MDVQSKFGRLGGLCDAVRFGRFQASRWALAPEFIPSRKYVQGLTPSGSPKPHNHFRYYPTPLCLLLSIASFCLMVGCERKPATHVFRPSLPVATASSVGRYH